ncbi:FtsX-like permease family protein [Arachidicoccus rhizosphaerae]|uniref:FtsX-like permease family protein n=1 Tax=Arachidicoccus rhizosphaerae TaxID=551991 RepID=A0A1H3ZMH8_9BACT|nr:ABC transporter permease [Arachidicoccus rhizosphaerae]SEA24989.1 FtsX-like permease family protein [Arachidicoccus rhizosphaerae]
MFNLYIKPALRNFRRNKLFSVLNITGLAIGMAGAMLIGLWVYNMTRYDRFYKDESQLYILRCKGVVSGEMQTWKWVPKILGPTMIQEVPEVSAMTRYDNNWKFLFTANDKILEADQGSFADPDFFKMFGFSFVEGGPTMDWDNGNGIVITQQFAKTLFGDKAAEAVGRSIKIDSVDVLKVTGVLKDFPANTMFKSNYILSWKYGAKLGFVDSNWFNNNVQTFIKVAKGTPLAGFNRKIEGFVGRHSTNPNTAYKILAEPFSRNYLYDTQQNGEFVTGRIVLVKSMIVIGIFMLLLACFNFMNLTTAQSEQRAREVGVKKALGASRKKLMIQFLTEGLLLTLAAFIIAGALALLILPFFNHLVDMDLRPVFNLKLALALGILILATTLMAGSYPALYLSSFSPIKVLGGKFKRMSAKLNLRSVLFVVQFTISMVLIVGTIMIVENINYARSRSLGYEKDGLMFSWFSGHLDQNYLPLRNALLQSGAVSSVSKNMSPVSLSQSNGWGMSWTGSSADASNIQFLRFSSDADMVKTLGMKLIKGRDIDIYKYPADSTAMILTESAVKAMHLKQEIGTIVKDNRAEWHVVGVIKDFVIDGPFENIRPMMIEGPRSWFDVIHYRLNPAHPVQENLSTIKKVFDQYNPGFPFSYNFADQAFQKKFEQSERYRQIAVFAAGLAIFISCLGLFGLMTYMAEMRMKEIGIRKVLGASAKRLFLLLSKGFLSMLFISFIVSTPVAIYLAHVWLSKFDYRIHISVLWFVEAFCISLVIALATICGKAWKVASTSPVNSLKTE